jgi:diacylglycerol kinase family enzyme
MVVLRSTPSTTGSDPRFVVVINPATRRGHPSLISTFRDAAPPGVELDICVTPSPGEATALARARSPGAQAVVAVGGDGTVADVATGILGRGVPLGIVPAGSTNITARELGIPTNPRDAARLLFGRHHLVELDVGRCNDRSFLHIGGAGLDSRFFARTDPALKRRIGWLAYLPAAAAAVQLPPPRFTITTDREEMTVVSPLVLIANGRSVITPALRLHPEIRSDDGWLDVLIFTAISPWPIAQTLAQFLALGLERSRYLTRIRSRRVVLHADPPLPVELDGDCWWRQRCWCRPPAADRSSARSTHRAPYSGRT